MRRLMPLPLSCIYIPNDADFLNNARLCLNITKQVRIGIAPQPISGYGDPGIAVEAMNLITHRGREGRANTRHGRRYIIL